MAKQVISALIYQVGNQSPFKTGPQTMGINVNSIRGPIIALSPTLQTGNSLNMDSSLAYKCYSAIPQVMPSNAGVQYLFCNKTPDQIVTDINT